MSWKPSSSFPWKAEGSNLPQTIDNSLIATAAPNSLQSLAEPLVLRLREEREVQTYHCSSKFLIMLQSSDHPGNQTQISLVLKEQNDKESGRDNVSLMKISSVQISH